MTVSHDTRLEEIADRVLWLEDGTFRELATMATDPVCGIAMAQHDRPHLQLDGTVWWFCSAACRDEFATDPTGSPIVPRAAGPVRGTWAQRWICGPTGTVTSWSFGPCDPTGRRDTPALWETR